jgi:O-antigen ligase
MKYICAGYCLCFVVFQFVPDHQWIDDLMFLVLVGVAANIIKSDASATPFVAIGTGAAFGVSAMISSYTSIDMKLSAPRFYWLMNCCVMALLLWQFSTRMKPVELFDAVSIPVALAVLPFVAEWIGAGAPLLYRPLMERNNMMALFSLMLFPAIAFKRWWIVGMSTFVSWFAASRGGTLGIIAGTALYRSRWAVLSSVVAIVSVLIVRGDVLSASGDVVSSLSENSARSEYWRIAFEMWRSAPLFGTGLWSGLIYQPLGHAHNLWLNTLAEQGIMGVLTLGAFVAALWRELWRGKQWWALASFAALNVHSLFDTPTSAAYIVLMMSAVVVLGIRQGENNDATSQEVSTI